MLLSFIIPTYHCEAYIDRSLKSIRMLMEQMKVSEDEYEIIKIDDLHHEGPATIRNRGIDQARGEWIWFVDGDDEVKSLSAADSKAMFDALRTKEIELIAFNYEEEFPNKTLVVNKYAKTGIVDGATLIKRSTGGSYLWNKIFRRSAIGNNRFINGIFHIEDMCFNLHVIIHLAKILCLPVTGYVYHRDNNNSISHTNNPQTRIIANEDSLKVYQSLQTLAGHLSGEQRAIIEARLNFDIIAHLYTIFRFDDRRTLRYYAAVYRKMGLIPVRRSHNLKADLFGFFINIFSLFDSCFHPIRHHS